MPTAKSWAPKGQPWRTPQREWITDGEEPSTRKKRSVGEAYMVEIQGSKAGKRAATTAKNSRRCNALNALRMSRVASSQSG
jgi:hypothetical protein